MSPPGEKIRVTFEGQRSDYLTASAMRLLSFLRSVVRRPIRYDGSRPLQKTVPTELNNSSLLSSAAAFPSARHTSFMICRDGPWVIMLVSDCRLIAHARTPPPPPTDS